MAFDTETATAKVSVEHIGGIEEYSLSVEPGVTLLVGDNATNRTSLLQAIAAACGSENATLKASKSDGSVNLEIGDERYTRRLSRTRSDGVDFTGEPYLDDPRAADLFAFLLGNNRTRRAVIAESELRDVIMTPVDMGEIEREIDRLREEVSELRDQQDKRERLRTERLPELGERQRQLTEEIDEITEKRREKQGRLDSLEDEDSDGDQAPVDETLATLRDHRVQLQELEAEIAEEERSRERMQERLDTVLAEIDELSLPEEDRTELRQTQQALWDQREALDDQIQQLQTLVDFNRKLLSETSSVLSAIDWTARTESDPSADEAEALTRQLSEPGSEREVCWTCGQTVNRAQIKSTLDTLMDHRQTLYRKYETVTSRIESVEADLSRLEEAQSERDRLVDEHQQLQEEIDRTDAVLESLRERRESLGADIADLEAELEAAASDDHEEAIIELHSAISELEVRQESLERKLADVENEIADVEDTLEELADVPERTQELRTELKRRRTSLERLEDRTIEAFNGHMETLLDELDYENITRVWLERRADVEGERTHAGDETVFEMHVVRSTDDGTVFEDSLAHLSESERNVVALVFALAGYLAHDVYEEVPFMLLDSLEMIDATRTARLLEYFSEYPDYLIAVVLTEELDPLLAEMNPDSVVGV